MHMYNFLCSDSLLYFFLFLSTLHSVYTRDCSCTCAIFNSKLGLSYGLCHYDVMHRLMQITRLWFLSWKFYIDITHNYRSQILCSQSIVICCNILDPGASKIGCII